ncbi:MAG: hypothetical protein GY856_04950, partial [bacterium]|nr:hypothetical protein [bacterium]
SITAVANVPINDLRCFHQAPNWGSYDPTADDDPSLDLDDSDGAGPENLNLDKPQYGLAYTIGIHYWDDHGFGTSFATVRVYIADILVFQEEWVELAQHDMWEVATIDWPSGAITPLVGADGGHEIVNDFTHPIVGIPKD